MTDLQDPDYNGACFIVGSTGEREELIDVRRVVVPQGMPFDNNTRFAPGDANHRGYLDLFYRLNYHWMVEANSTTAADGTVVHPGDAVLARIRRVAYIRMLCAREGMYDWVSPHSAHNVVYSDFIQVTWQAFSAFCPAGPDGNPPVVTNLATAQAALPAIPNAQRDRVWQNSYRPKHMNAVCIVAYFFRVRGHHWTEEMDGRYSAVWQKCLYTEDNPGVEWRYIAHDALHAIYPDDLDTLWRNAAANDRCSGALIKRVDSKPAGIAGVAALNAGLADIRMVVPKALEFARDAVTHLAEVTTAVDAHRWGGSVNRRFYNAPEIRVNESALSALAAIIRAGLDGFNTGSPLLRSKALERIAMGAPITGAVIGRMIVTAARSDAAAQAFVPGAGVGT